MSLEVSVTIRFSLEMGLSHGGAVNSAIHCANMSMHCIVYKYDSDFVTPRYVFEGERDSHCDVLRIS